MEIVDNKVLRCEGRDIIRVIMPKGDVQPFYKSSGRNPNRPGEWLPFDGLYIIDGIVRWFDKKRFVCDAGGKYHNVDHDCLHRYGTKILKKASEIIGRWELPSGKETCPLEINEWIGYVNPFANWEKKSS